MVPGFVHRNRGGRGFSGPARIWAETGQRTPKSPRPGSGRGLGSVWETIRRRGRLFLGVGIGGRGFRGGFGSLCGLLACKHADRHAIHHKSRALKFRAG